MNPSRLRSLVDWPPRVTHLGVSLTRICFAAVILADMVQVYLWRDTSFVGASAWVGRWAVPACIVALAFFGAGLAARASAIATFVLVRVVYSSIHDVWALDHVVQAVTFVFLFAPAPKALAVDLVLRRRGVARGPEPAPFEIVPAWFSLALLLCLEIVYANSTLNKLRSGIWPQGLAFWLAATVPHFSAGRFPDALQIPGLVRAPTYFALVFEAAFPLVLVRPLRRWFVLVGAGLHLGIAFFLPIPSFGLGFASLYLFLVDWEPLARRLGRHDPGAREPARPAPGGDAAAGRPRRRPSLGFALPLFIAVGEALATIPARIMPLATTIRPPLSLFGLRNYGLYVDSFFQIPKPVVRLVVTSGGRRVDVPSFDERGYPEATNRYWSLLAIGNLRYGPGAPDGDADVNRFLRGTLTRAGVRDAEVTFYARDVSMPLRMNPTLADDLQRRPWTPLGTAVYHDGHAEIAWAPPAPAP